MGMAAAVVTGDDDWPFCHSVAKKGSSVLRVRKYSGETAYY